jgi:glycosyltransferase involved in cell wall biosynthesis
MGEIHEAASGSGWRGTVMVIAFDGRPMQGNARGMGVYARGLLAGFVEAGLADSVSVVLDRAMPRPELPAAYAVRVRMAGGPGGAVAWEQWHLPRAAAGCDVLHCTANAGPLISPVPVVLTLHDVIFLRKWREISDRTYARQLAGHLYRTRAYPPGARRAAALVTVSEASRAGISASLRVPAERITVIHEAPGPAFASAATAPEAGIREKYGIQGPYLAAMGGYERRKNVAVLIRMLGNRMPGLPPTLVLAGAENIGATRYREEAERLEAGTTVRFLPYLDPGDLKGLLAASAAFLWPSLREGFGLPILEAMLAGAPVVASDISVNREVAGAAAAYADPLDPRSWACVVAEICGNARTADELRKMGAERAASFSWRRAAEETMKIYCSVAGSR